jgi:hypothetical protein
MYPLYAQREKVQSTLEYKCGAIECESGNVEVQLNNITVLNTICDLVWKVETRANKPCITQEIISKTYERRKQKNVNSEEGRKHSRRLRNQFQSPDKAKTKYLASTCDENIEFPRAGCYDLTYMMTKKLG